MLSLFAAEGKYVDATQEMVALGVCNMASAFVHSMPVSGALSRGAVNHASGVASTAGGLYTGALVLLSLQVYSNGASEVAFRMLLNFQLLLNLATKPSLVVYKYKSCS